jgi:hypothetical protein
MTGWEKQSLELLNQGLFRINSPGPLHAPIHRFSIRRDDKFALILETEAAPDAKSVAVQYPDGTVRFNKEQVELDNIAGVKARLSGVLTYSLSTTYGTSHAWSLKELATVHELVVTPGDLSKAAYSIEWLENLPASPFIWPDDLRTVTETTSTWSIASSNDGITLSDASNGESFARAAAMLTVAGEKLYVCALKREDTAAGIKPGCIVYVGTTDNLIRKKIRTALSFALGVYLVELGHTLYDEQWRIVSATSRSPYTLDKKVFDLAPMPLAPLSNRHVRYDLDRSALTRMVSALVASYEMLDLGNLSWAYWHACAATIHIAPAHFGAAIEAIQQAYIESHPGAITSRILVPARWTELQTAIASMVNAADIPEDSKCALRDNLGRINQVPQRTVLKAVLQTIGIELGSDEDDAWKRRNDAAHGVPIPEGDELAAIRDMMLLRVLFHRLLLRMSGAADSYVDYVTPGFAYRPLNEPVPSMLGSPTTQPA